MLEYLVLVDNMAGIALLDVKRILEALDIAPGSHIADLAAGRTGHFALPLSRLVGSLGRVYSVDILPEVIAALEGHRAHHGLTQLVPVWGDVEKHEGVNIAEHSLDWALLVNALGSMKEREVAARETVRLMKPRGRIVVIDWLAAAKHPMAKLARSVPPAHVDAIFDHVGCLKCGEFKPSAWHYGRVYAS